MLEAGRELHLALEPLDVDAGGQLGVEHLDDDAAPSAVSSATNTRDMPPPPSSRVMVYAPPSEDCS
jgi:hypothetical protein